MELFCSQKVSFRGKQLRLDDAASVTEIVETILKEKVPSPTFLTSFRTWNLLTLEVTRSALRRVKFSQPPWKNLNIFEL